MNTIEELKKLKSLFDQGAITQDEFDSLKKNIISSGIQEKDALLNQKSNLKDEENVILESNNKTSKIAKPNTGGNKTKNTKAVSNKKNENTSYKNNSTKWEDNNNATLNLVNISRFFGLVLGLVFVFRYTNFFALVIPIGLSIGASIAIAKLIPKLLVRNISLGMLSVVLVLLISFPIGNTSFGKSKTSSNSSSENYSGTSTSTRTCAWCGKSYSGDGYYHLGNECVKGDKNLGAGNMCSIKCCQEEWLTDPNNPNAEKR